MKKSKEESAEAQILGGSAQRGELEEPLRVRLATDSVTGLDQIEAFFQGQGYRHVSRSHLVRVAIDRLVQDVTSEHPEIKKIILRPSR